MLVQLLAQSPPTGPMGEEFGKASPVGVFVVLAMAVVVLFLGWRLSLRVRRMNQRRAFAQDHGIDPFDVETLDKAMREAGINVPERTPFL
ncbi:MAG: hypothetical protein SPI77_04275 [Corynebacterium sp.]|nr:hypothetical protein [Corynebacterium sp.]